MTLKHTLASLIVRRIHGEAGASAAALHFRRVVQDKELPDDIPEVSLSLTGEGGLIMLDMLERLELIKSRSEGRRLVQQGAVSIDARRIEDPLESIGRGTCLLRVGKRRFVRVRID